MGSRTDTNSSIALHACCGPCLLEPYDALAAEHDRVVVVYANPNIHPVEEYERRSSTIRAYAEANDIEFVELEYDPGAWLAAVEGAGTRAERCRACYRVRLEMTAAWAAEQGVGALATTLTVSPYQDADAIAEAGERVASDSGLRYVSRDFRERYGRATQRSRELGMYRQNHCGCGPSEMEARSEREARKAARRARRG